MAGPPACDFARVQPAIDAANPGDRILLRAGETFGGFILRHKPGAEGNPIVITTTAEAYLPAPDTRLTPAYSVGPSPVTARIQGSSELATITTENGTDGCPGSAAPCPAHDYVLVGLEIVPAAFAYDHVRIGPVQRSDGVTTVDGLPYNITLDRDYIHQNRLSEVRRCVTPHGRNIVIENSWIAGCKQRGYDSQAIESWNGAGPLLISNNYLEAATEVVSFGGALPTIPGLVPQAIEIAFNHISRPDFYLNGTTQGLNGVWSAGSFYGAGKFIFPTAQNGLQYWAQNSGTSGAQEPDWPVTPGATVRDGDIVWLAQVQDAGSRWLVKNLLESKSSDGLYVHDNVFENSPGASQFHAIVLTVRTSQDGPWARVWHTSFLHNVVRNADAVLNTLGRDGSDPNLNQLWQPGATYYQDELVVSRTANGVQYRAGNNGVSGYAQPLWPTTPGATVADGTMVWTAEPLPAGAWTWTPNGMLGTTKFLDIRNNLFTRIGRGYGWGPAGDTSPVLALNNGITAVNIDHNTIDFLGATLLGGAGYPGTGTFTNNLASKGSYGVFGSGRENQIVQGCAAIQYLLCNDPTSPAYPDPAARCGAGVFAKNVISGYSISGRDPCIEPDRIPAGNWGTAWDQIGFEDPSQSKFHLVSSSAFAGLGTDGQPLGTDTDVLPLIRDLNVQAGDTQAAFTYTAPNAIPCTLQVSTDREFGTVVPDVDPTLFARADSDAFRGPSNGQSRTFVVGGAVDTGLDGNRYRRALAPGTTYWYWLACGGDAQQGSFTTTGDPAQ